MYLDAGDSVLKIGPLRAKIVNRARRGGLGCGRTFRHVRV
jgi:hypothetical protein